MYTARGGRSLGADGLEDILEFEGSLGIAPVVVAAVVPLAAKLVGAIAGLFGKRHNPSPEVIAKVRTYFDWLVQRWANNYENGNADGAAARLETIRAYAAGTNPSGGKVSDTQKQYAQAAIDVITQYIAQNPPKTVTTSTGGTTQIDANATQTTLQKKPDGSGFQLVPVAGAGGLSLGGILGGGGGGLLVLALVGTAAYLLLGGKRGGRF